FRPPRWRGLHPPGALSPGTDRRDVLVTGYRRAQSRQDRAQGVVVDVPAVSVPAPVVGADPEVAGEFSQGRGVHCHGAIVAAHSSAGAREHEGSGGGNAKDHQVQDGNHIRQCHCSTTITCALQIGQRNAETSTISVSSEAVNSPPARRRSGSASGGPITRPSTKARHRSIQGSKATA